MLNTGSRDRRTAGRKPQLQGRAIGVLIESDYYEPEIFYYRHRFAEEGAEIHFLSRLWGQPTQTYRGHEFGAPFLCDESFEEFDDARLREFAAIIVPSGMVADRLRYTEDVRRLPPATTFLQRAFAEPGIVKGIICHGIWLLAPVPELACGRRVVAHNNLLGDVRNMGAEYVDEDVVVDGDLVTARTGEHCHLFARTLIEVVASRPAETRALRRGDDLPRGRIRHADGGLPRGRHALRERARAAQRAG
jgi:protease I